MTTHDWSTGISKPVSLQPVQFVDLDEAHAQEAINALADLLVPILRAASQSEAET